MKVPSRFNLPPRSAHPVKEMLKKRGFRFSEHENAVWHGESEGTHVIFYRNGTVLLQGKDPGREKWYQELSRFDSGKEDVGENAGTASAMTDERILGLDESGKGDFFGPLVLAGAVVPNADEKKLAALGVQDSKKLSDPRIKSVFQKIKDHAEFKVRVIEPEEYNRLYSEHRNLNRLMMEEYKGLIGRFDSKRYDRVILDQFSSSDRQNQDLRKSLSKDILIVPKGESNGSVALASVVARYHFIEWIEKTSEKKGFDVPIGSGPASGELFRRLKNGADRKLFLSLAKAHFKSGTGADSLF